VSSLVGAYGQFLCIKALHNLAILRTQCVHRLLAQAPLAVLEGFGEVVGFDDVGAVEVGDGSG